MKYLVTGAAGFIGFFLTKKLLETGNSVVGIDNINNYYSTDLKYGRLRELGIIEKNLANNLPCQSSNSNFIFIKTDISNSNSMHDLFKNYAFDCVIHLAAQAGVRYSLENPSAYIQSNIVGFFNIIENCKNHPTFKHLLYASSSSVYGLNTQSPYKTDAKTDFPISLYAATKKSDELIAHSYSHLYELPVTGLRFFTVYGPFGRPDMAYYKFAQAIQNNQVISVYNNGNMYRDFTYIDDIINGIVKLLSFIPHKNCNEETKAAYQIFNIGNDSPVLLNDFVTLLEKLLNKKALIEYLPMQPGDVLNTHADISNLFTAIKWKPQIKIDEGLKKFVQWFIEYAGQKQNPS